MNDLIERQAALNALMDAVISVGVLDADDIKTVFDALPSVQHEKGQHSKEGTTSDMISRQAAIDVVEKNACNTQRIMDAVNNLPTAQPEPKEGHWIPHESLDGGEQYECSRCGVLWEFNDGTPEDNEAYFCPKCGARMTTSTK